jgi:hypothetical protein
VRRLASSQVRGPRDDTENANLQEEEEEREEEEVSILISNVAFSFGMSSQCLNRSGFDAASFCEKDADLCPSITQSSSVSVR